MQGELKVRELEQFKACYCGLCRAIGNKYGIASRFALSYELVFLAMMLWDSDDAPKMEKRRCIASPFRKKRFCVRNASLDVCAGYNVILTWWKLRDTIADEPFIKSMPHRFLTLLLSRAYKKASRELKEFDANARDELAQLTDIETRGSISLDAAADKFARILAAAAPKDAPDSTRRPMAETLYHLGRWIYIIDACDDYKKDAIAGRYNPVAAKYPPERGALTEEAKERLRTTLTHSNNLLCSAFELHPENPWTETLRNTIYLGMSEVCMRVLGNRE